MKQSIIKVAAMAAHVAEGPGRRVLHCGRGAVRVAAKPGIYVVRRGIGAADYAVGTALTVATAMVAMLPAAPVGAAMAIVAAVVALLPSMRANAALKITTVSQTTRPSSSTYGAEQISGITYAGGNLFYAVDDNDKKLYPLTLAINRANGQLATSGITIGTGISVSGANDMEGCAFDPASGKVWISEEPSARIREINPATGAVLRSAPVPSIMKQYYGNFSLEALTISGDGKTMWTCNEEALKCDGVMLPNTGSVANKTNGSTVRLTKFTRQSLDDNWTADGQWAYLTEPVGTDPDWSSVTSNADGTKTTNFVTRSGVSGLCALPDGTLLTLERRCYEGGFFPDFQIRIYQVNFSGADDISSITSLTNATYKRTSKTQLWQYTHGNALPNYEGICLGPRLDDGSCVLVLVGDGGSSGEEGIFTLKLSGLDISSLTVENSTGGKPSIAGGPYRFVSGTKQDISLDGTEYASCYTNNAAPITNVMWTLTGADATFGTGTKASFTISGDDTLTWLANSAPFSSPIDNADSFETYAAGALASDGEVGAWTGDGEVRLFEYTPPDPPGYAMPKDAHTRVLDIDGSVARDFSCTTNGNDRLDLMLQVSRRNADSPVYEIPDNTKLALQCGEDGVLQLYCRDSEGAAGWQPLDDGRTFEQGEWIRVSVYLDCTTSPGAEYALIRVNGKAFETAGGAHLPGAPASGGAWFRTAGGTPDGRIASLNMNGTTKLDDVIKTTEEFTAERSAATTAVDGVPLAWLAANDRGDDPQSPATSPRRRSLGYTLADIYDSGIDPDGDDPFQITDIRILDDGRIELELNGLREDLTASQRDALYPIYRRETVGGEETPVAGTTEISGGRTIWTSSEPVNLEQGFYRAKVQPQR